jgi:hypothetical protein
MEERSKSSSYKNSETKNRGISIKTNRKRRHENSNECLLIISVHSLSLFFTHTQLHPVADIYLVAEQIVVDDHRAVFQFVGHSERKLVFGIGDSLAKKRTIITRRRGERRKELRTKQEERLILSYDMEAFLFLSSCNRAKSMTFFLEFCRLTGRTVVLE